MTVEWGPELSVGFDELDAQHREIVRLLGDVGARVEARDAAGTGMAIGALASAVIRHFAAEEAMMERWQYPERSAHKQAHDLFLQDILALERDEAEDGLTEEVVDWAMGRLPEWMSFHMLTNDAPLGRFLATRGLRSPARARAEKSQSS